MKWSREQGAEEMLSLGSGCCVSTGPKLGPPLPPLTAWHTQRAYMLTLVNTPGHMWALTWTHVYFTNNIYKKILVPHYYFFFFFWKILRLVWIRHSHHDMLPQHRPEYLHPGSLKLHIKIKSCCRWPCKSELSRALNGHLVIYPSTVWSVCLFYLWLGLRYSCQVPEERNLIVEF